MRKITILTLSALLLLTGCNNQEEEKEYTSFKDYVTNVKNANGGDFQIYVFTQDGCSDCKAINELIDRYAEDVANDYKVYQLDLTSIKEDNQKVFKDATMGTCANDSTKNYIKALDNRIASYVNKTKCPTGDDKLLKENPIGSSNYSYVATPLVIWYVGNIEVKFSNNIDAFITKNRKSYDYESFKSFMNFDSNADYYNWNDTFELTYVKVPEQN